MDKHDTLPAEPSALDAHGFDPKDFDWIPVPRQRRADGWSPATQREFIEALADTGSVTDAARTVRMTPKSCYRLRRSPGAEGFAAAWDAAIAEASKRLVDIAFDRAINGVEDPIVGPDGIAIYTRRRYNDRLLMFLLRHHHPERYARPDSAGAPPPAPVAEPAAVRTPIPIAGAIATLEPAPPAEPHRLMPPEELSGLMENYAANMREEERLLAGQGAASDKQRLA